MHNSAMLGGVPEFNMSDPYMVDPHKRSLDCSQGGKRQRAININEPSSNIVRNLAMGAAGDDGNNENNTGKGRRVARTCHHENCGKNPYFGWHGERALFCVAHKEPGMVDVKNKRCEANGCMKRGLFGFDGERARFCGGHRLEGMIDLKNKRCKWVGCAKQATFALEGKSTACFCPEHRSTGMVDLKGRRCETANCLKQASYALEGQSPSYCLAHRGPGMVDVKPRNASRFANTNNTNTIKGAAYRGEPSGTTTPRGAGGSIQADNKLSGVASPTGKFQTSTQTKSFTSSSGLTRSSGSAADAASYSSFAAKWGKRSGKSANSGVGGTESGGVDQTRLRSDRFMGGNDRDLTMRVEPAGSHVDLLRPARRTPSPAYPHNPMRFSATPGLTPRAVGVSGGSLGCAMRTWNVSGRQLGGGMGPGMPPMSSWAPTGDQLTDAPFPPWMNGAATDGGVLGGGSGSSSGWSGGMHDLSPLVEQISDSSPFYTSSYESTTSILPPLAVRSCSSLPSCTFVGGTSIDGGWSTTGAKEIGAGSYSNRAGSTGSSTVASERLSAGGIGLKAEGGVSTGVWVGGMVGSEGPAPMDSWSSSASTGVLGEPLESPSGTLPGVDSHTYGVLSMGGVEMGAAPICVGQACASASNGNRSRACSADRNCDESVHGGAPALQGKSAGSVGMPEIEVYDGWIPDFMHGTMGPSSVGYPTSPVSLQQQQQHSSGTSAAFLRQCDESAGRGRGGGGGMTPPFALTFSQSQQLRSQQGNQQRLGQRQSTSGGVRVIATGVPVLSVVPSTQQRQRRQGELREWAPLADAALSCSPSVCSSSDCVIDHGNNAGHVHNISLTFSVSGGAASSPGGGRSAGASAGGETTDESITSLSAHGTPQSFALHSDDGGHLIGSVSGDSDGSGGNSAGGSHGQYAEMSEEECDARSASHGEGAAMNNLFMNVSHPVGYGGYEVFGADTTLNAGTATPSPIDEDIQQHWGGGCGVSF